MKKQQAPSKVKAVAQIAFIGEMWKGMTNDKTAEIKKATQPKKLMALDHQLML